MTTFTPGVYPVMLAIADLPNAMQICIYAAILFLDHPPISWESAHFSQDGVPTIQSSHWVDSGTSCFMDVLAKESLVRLFQQDVDDSFREGLVKEIYSKQHHLKIGYTTLHFPLVAANCVIFETGFGDGWFPSYIGYDDNHAVACLLTDFLAIDYAE